MLSQNKIKFIRSLDLKKHREAHQCFIVEGEKMVLELLNSNFNTLELFALKNFIDKHSKDIDKRISIIEILEQELNKISGLKTPNQVLAVVKIPETKPNASVFSSLCIALDNIQDPGNMGTIIRTANWFGVTTIFCSTDTVDAYNSKVIQATMGAIFRTTIFYGDLSFFISEAKKNGQAIYGTLLDGKNLYDADLKNNAIIVLGNESKGISKPIQHLIDHKIRIPNFPENTSDMESLNVAIAGAVVLAEFRRKHIK